MNLFSLCSLYDFHKNNEFSNKIDFYNLENSKFVYSPMHGESLFWTSVLASDNELVFIDNQFMVFYSKKFDFYSVHFIAESDTIFNTIKTEIYNKLSKNNFLHFIIGGTTQLNKKIINFFEKENTNSNCKYSVCNINSEIFYEDEPSFNLNELNNISYLFTGGTLSPHINKNNKGSWHTKNPDKFILDFKYPLIYFYFKFGFNYYQFGEQMIDIANRENKVFLYSKNSGKHTTRYQQVQRALSTGRIFDKPYSNSDWFWYFANYNYYHMPFFHDYNICKFNLVMETQDPIQSNNLFLSEKTLKGLMVSTPAYTLLIPDVYNSLKEYGFYFVNSEFGEYSNTEPQNRDALLTHPYVWNQNYQKFLDFLTNANDEEFDNFFKVAFEKSKQNKVLLEKYIYSDKKKEINLLFN